MIQRVGDKKRNRNGKKVDHVDVCNSKLNRDLVEEFRSRLFLEGNINT